VVHAVAEGQVRIVRTGQVQFVGVVEHGDVAVRGVQLDQYRFTGADAATG
jgi:hypothetical protein